MTQDSEKVTIQFQFPPNYNLSTVNCKLSSHNTAISVSLIYADLPPLLCGPLFDPVSGMTVNRDSEKGTLELTLVKTIPREWDSVIKYASPDTKIDPKSCFDKWMSCAARGEKAMDLLVKSTAVGYCMAMNTLGVILLSQPQTHTEGIITLLTAINKYQDLTAMCTLGSVWVMSQDEDERTSGLDLLLRAADLNHSTAFFDLGQIYSPISAVPIPKDPKKSVEYFRKYLDSRLEIDESFDPWVHYYLGKMYARGYENFEADAEKAAEHTRLAREGFNRNGEPFPE